MKQLISALGLSLGLILSGCGGGTDGTASASNTGIIALSLTDAPTDHEDITGVLLSQASNINMLTMTMGVKTMRVKASGNIMILKNPERLTF